MADSCKADREETLRETFSRRLTFLEERAIQIRDVANAIDGRIWLRPAKVTSTEKPEPERLKGGVDFLCNSSLDQMDRIEHILCSAADVLESIGRRI